jgi:hypothetical protein
VLVRSSDVGIAFGSTQVNGERTTWRGGLGRHDLSGCAHHNSVVGKTLGSFRVLRRLDQGTETPVNEARGDNLNGQLGAGAWVIGV